MQYTLINLPNYGLLKVSGRDAAKLLQGQLTCDVLNLPNHGCHSAQCNPQGRIISLFYLFFYQEAYFLFMPNIMLPITLASLKKYAAFYKVTVTDASAEFICAGIFHSNPELKHFAYSDSRKLTILANDTSKTSLFADSLHESWKQMDIAEHIPQIYPQTSGQFLPHELSLDNLNLAISFSKGCYTGQEIIARMHYKAKLKKRLYRASIKTTEELIPGTVVYCDNQVNAGVIVDYWHKNSYEYTALVIIDETHLKKTIYLKNQQSSVELLA